jgi:hypothetical protein
MMIWVRHVKRKGFIPAYALSLFIWIMASLPGGELRKIQTFSDYALLRSIFSDAFMHFLVFGLLTLLICRGYSQELRFVPWVRVGLMASGDGLLLELYQGILPGWSFGVDALVWNTVGVLFFLIICRGLQQLKLPDFILKLTK